MDLNDSNNRNSDLNPFHPSLVSQMLQSNRNTTNYEITIDIDHSDGQRKETKKITNEALIGAGEIIRLFVREAWHRASIEAECEYEGEFVTNKLNEVESANSKSATNDGNKIDPPSIAHIRADHVTKIAAELLMDFS